MPDMSGERLYLIDAYSVIFRAFYAIRNLSSSKGEPTNAVYGFVNMLRKLLRDHEPAFIGMAFDVSGKTFRKEKYEDYKANRKPMPDDLRTQMPWIRKAIDAFRIPILELEGYEADDVLGTVSRKAEAEGFEVVLVSADKDLMQLVGPHTFMLHTGREKLYDAALVEEDFGVPPEQVIDVLALMGDSVDNVPGVKGIGEKGAKTLIKEYGSLDELLERAGELTRKAYREGLQENRQDALLSKELVTIVTDLPVPFDPESLRLQEPDGAALAEVYRELEFFTLLKELEQEGAISATADVEPAIEVTSAEEWLQRTADLSGRVHVAALGDDPIALAVVMSDGEVLLADFRGPAMGEAALERLREWVGDESVELAGHDTKELLRLAGPETKLRARLLDTMVLAYLLPSSVRSFSLEEVAFARLQTKPMTLKEAGWAGSSTPDVGGPELLRFAAERALLPKQLLAQVETELESAEVGAKARQVYERLEEPLMPVLVAMEETGVELDVEFLAAMSVELGEELERLEGEIYDISGEPFNINSPRQLGAIMFEKLGYPVIKRTRKTKSYSTGADTLEALAAQGFDLPERILRFRESAKLKSTYVDALPVLVDDNGRLHTRFQQAVTATGRLSSTNPNLQNIPIRTEAGRRIRKAFTAPAGRVLLVADYSQIELRVLAHIAQEGALIDAFQSGEDIHSSTAASVFGGSPALVTPDQRRAAKVINFGIIYGMSPFGLGNNLGIPQKEAKAFIDAYFERFPAVRSYIDKTVEAAEEEGKVETLYGRARWLPDIRSKNWNLRENAKRMAINARIQGTAADLLKLAMIAVDRRLRSEFPQASLLLTVHDELVLEVPEEEAEEVASLVRSEMEGVEKLDVPLVVEGGWGANWHDAKA
jgi:DNA polymerase-1